MDYGNAMGSVLTTDIAPYQIDREYDCDYLRYLLRLNKMKMTVAFKVFQDIAESHKCLKKMHRISSRLRKEASLYCLKLRMANVETFLHLLNRYILSLQRDSVKLQTQLRGRIPQPLYSSFRRNQDCILSNPPNVHRHFVWADKDRQGETVGINRQRTLSLWGGHIVLNVTSREHSDVPSSPLQSNTTLNLSEDGPETANPPLSPLATLIPTHSSSVTSAVSLPLLDHEESLNVAFPETGDTTLSLSDTVTAAAVNMTNHNSLQSTSYSGPSWITVEEMEVPRRRRHSVTSVNPTYSTEIQNH